MRTFADFNPIVITVYLLTVAGIAMFCINPVIFLLSLVGAVAYYGFSYGISAKNLLFYIVMFLVLTIINPIVSHNGVTVLFVVNNNPITLEAVIYGASSALMLVGVMYWFSAYSKIMTSDKLLYLFGSLSPKLSLILSMALRYVPLFKGQAVKVEQSQKALGLYKEDNIADNMRNKLRVFSILVTWALENGIITADSMSSKAYGSGKRTHFKGFRFIKSDYILLGICLCLGAVTITSVSGLEFKYYPAIVAPKLTVRSLATYIAYGILAILPVLIEVKEVLKWKYLKSKI